MIVLPEELNMQVMSNIDGLFAGINDDA